MDTMEALRDALVRIQVEHEQTCPGGGQPCWLNRCNRIAYLAHALGIKKPEQWQEVISLAKSYDARCEALDCLHEAS